jgi:putative nucleotidyltransferase with HDIG domain
MPNDDSILLISDRGDRNRPLANRLSLLRGCQVVALYEDEAVVQTPGAIIVDVDLCSPTNIDRLRQVMARARSEAATVIAVLRDETHVERVQATAIGATVLLPAGQVFCGALDVLAPVIRTVLPPEELRPDENIEQARLDLQTIFAGAASGIEVNPALVANATSSVIAAVAQGGIRRWLDVVWTYDDLTYQHCLLVTGLAAAFAAQLKFCAADQNSVVRGALLHDVGKSKIPLEILNKPDVLSANELIVMRQHVRLGYDLLVDQGGYEPDLLEVVLRHHELLDGSGYPDGLAGSQVTDLVRLVTICDVYAALIERRPYKQPIEPTAAFNILRDMEGKLEGPLIGAFDAVAKKAASGPVGLKRASPPGRSDRVPL